MNKKSKSNDDEAVRSRERCLKAKLVALESKHAVEAIEATSKAEHNVTVAYEKELQKQQQEHSKIQSVTATQLNKYKRMNDDLKDRNLKSRTTTTIKISN